MKRLTLPKITVKKKINHIRFTALAKKVRESLREEQRYLEARVKIDENSSIGRFLLNS